MIKRHLDQMSEKMELQARFNSSLMQGAVRFNIGRPFVPANYLHPHNHTQNHHYSHILIQTYRTKFLPNPIQKLHSTVRLRYQHAQADSGESTSGRGLFTVKYSIDVTAVGLLTGVSQTALHRATALRKAKIIIPQENSTKII
jgi:hypothetical protein